MRVLWERFDWVLLIFHKSYCGTADTLAKSDRLKVNVRPFYRKFKSGSCETIHHLQRALYFKIALYQNTGGLQNPPNICSNSIVQATTIFRGSLGLISVGPRTHLRNPMDQKSICARFIGNSNLGFLKPYITRRTKSKFPANETSRVISGASITCTERGLIPVYWSPVRSETGFVILSKF